MGKVEERAAREFDAVCAERGVVAGLNELERLVREAGGRRDRALKGEGRGEGMGMGDGGEGYVPYVCSLCLGCEWWGG